MTRRFYLENHIPYVLLSGWLIPIYLCLDAQYAGAALTFVFVGLVLPALLFLLATYQRKSEYPEKSLLNNGLNLALGPIRSMNLGPYKDGELTMDKALVYAKKKTKLTDFGGMDFADTYKVIMDTATHRAQHYTNLGYVSARIELNMTFVRRLKMVEFLKNAPRVLDVPVPSPVFVMGLPRTGTTFLHRLLSLDPQVRAPMLWELLAPVPAMHLREDSSLSTLEADRKSRAAYVRKLIATRRQMGDRALEHIHEVGADLPEECFMALSDEIPCLLQFLYQNYMHPDISEPLIRKRMVKAYQWYKQYLQLLSWQIGERGGANGVDSESEGKGENKHPASSSSSSASSSSSKMPRRWMLKCPVHLFYTKEIAQAFPEAKLIWTHRHPISAVPSMCSLLKALHLLYFEKSGRDDHALGRTMLEVSERLLVQAPTEILESKLPCAHVIYNKLIDSPIEVIKAIYMQFGWNYTPEYERTMLDYLEDNRLERENVKAKMAATKKKGGASAVMHTYTPEEFGITALKLSEGGYAKYVSDFNVPLSTN